MGLSDLDVWNTDLFDALHMSHISSEERIAFGFRFESKVGLAIVARLPSLMTAQDCENLARSALDFSKESVEAAYATTGRDLQQDKIELTLRVKRLLLSSNNIYRSIEELEAATAALLPSLDLRGKMTFMHVYLELSHFIDLIPLNDMRKELLWETLTMRVGDDALRSFDGYLPASLLTPLREAFNHETGGAEALMSAAGLSDSDQENIFQCVASVFKERLNLLQRELAFLLAALGEQTKLEENKE